jgi:hypothetical protein
MKAAYEELSEDEFFDSDPDPDQVERVLGSGVLNDYMQWIYLHIK